MAADPAAFAAAAEPAPATTSSWWPRSSPKREDVPKLFYNPTGVAAQILEVAGGAAAAAGNAAAAAAAPAAPTPPLFSPFSPPPWLLSPHAQSGMAMARVVLAKRHGGYSERQQILTADGGTLALDWWSPHSPEASQRRLPSSPPSTPSSSSAQLRRQWLSDSSPVALLIHGINGGSFEGYILSCCAELASRGVRPVVLNLRGCGGTELTSGRGYTALQAPDVAVAVGSVAARFPRAPLLGVGFSLGAVLMAKYVAEADMGLISPHLGVAEGGGSSSNNKSAAAPPAAALQRPATASGSGFVAIALVSSPVCLHCINARMASPLTHPMPFIYNLLVAAKLRGYWRRHESAFAESGLIPREPPPPEPRAPAPPNPARATPSLVAVSAAKAAHEQQQRKLVAVSGGGGNGAAGAGGRAAGAGAGGAASSPSPPPAPARRLAGGGGRAAGSGGGWLSGAPLAVLERERARPVNAAKLSSSTTAASRGPRLPPRKARKDEGEEEQEAAAAAPPAPATPPTPQNPQPQIPAHLRNVGLTTAGFDGELMRQLGFSDRAGYYRHACSTNYLPHARTPTLLLVSRDDPFLGTVPARLCSASPWTVLALTRRGGHIGWAHGLMGQKCWSDAAVADWLMAALALWRRQPAGSGWVSAAAKSNGVKGFAAAGALSPALRAPRTPKEREAASRALADAACTCLAQQELRRRQREAARRAGEGGVRSRL
jgi:predicted alpha/beta-fold hydrolase